jgi:hypothetical protein
MGSANNKEHNVNLMASTTATNNITTFNQIILKDQEILQQKITIFLDHFHSDIIMVPKINEEKRLNILIATCSEDLEHLDQILLMLQDDPVDLEKLDYIYIKKYLIIEISVLMILINLLKHYIDICQMIILIYSNLQEFVKVLLILM